jgi:hypothetical protein
MLIQPGMSGVRATSLRQRMVEQECGWYQARATIWMGVLNALRTYSMVLPLELQRLPALLGLDLSTSWHCAVGGSQQAQDADQAVLTMRFTTLIVWQESLHEAASLPASSANESRMTRRLQQHRADAFSKISRSESVIHLDLSSRNRLMLTVPLPEPLAVRVPEVSRQRPVLCLQSSTQVGELLPTCASSCIGDALQPSPV